MSLAEICRQILSSLTVVVYVYRTLQYAYKYNLPSRDIVPAKSAVVSALNRPISACFRAVVLVHPRCLIG